MTSFFWQARSEVGGAGPQSGWIVDDAGRGEPGVPGAQKGAKKTDEPKAAKSAAAVKQGFAPRYKSNGEGVGDHEARRVAFARLLTADRQFARAAVNRHWGLLFGRGLVHPLDGFTAGRKPSHPELLEELTDDFIQSGYDVRRLLSSIVLSKPYQVSSRQGGPEGSAAGRFFSQAAVASLLPEQLLESLVRATGLDELKPSPKGKGGMPVDAFRESFFREFKPSLQPNEPASPATDPTISQALFFLNGDLVARGTATAAQLHLGRLLEREKDPARRIEDLFLATLSRLPKGREAETLLARARKAGDTPRFYEDLFWALLNSTEFVTRH
jgi:hypothetical protein